VEPVAVVLVNALATDLELNIVDEVVTDPVEPAELGASAVIRSEGNLGESRLEVDAADQITIALNGACHALTEVGGTIERVLNRLHGEVGVAAVHHLEEGNLGITG